MKHWTDILPEDACEDAVEWARTQPDYRTAWAVCERGDRMLWLAGRWADRRLVVRAAGEVARLALPYVPEDEERPRQTIETAEAWTRGEATIEEVRAAYSAAAAAAYAAGAAAYAAYAAAAAAAYAAGAAAYAAYAAAADAAYAAAEEVRADVLRRCADIVRRYWPEPPEFRA